MTKRFVKGCSDELTHDEAEKNLRQGHALCAHVCLTDSMLKCMEKFPTDVCMHSKKDFDLIWSSQYNYIKDGAHYMTCIGFEAQKKDGLEFYVMKDSYGEGCGYYGFYKIYKEHLNEFYVVLD